jgi:aminomethyltransferase
MHRSHGGRLIEFAGWEMPIQYSGVVDEYHAVRSAAGLFDVSHMGRLTVRGAEAVPFLQQVVTTDVGRLAPGAAQYSMVLNPRGGIQDDIFVYRRTNGEFLLCVNASNRGKIFSWLRERAAGRTGLDVQDRSGETAQLAVQGPSARAVMEECGVPEAESLRARQCVEAALCGIPALIARTGYTGEHGYELYCEAAVGEKLWNVLMIAGKSAGLKPAGLGARDLLRLEMAYLLYGNEISEETTPLEAGVEWVVAWDKGDFIGRDALIRQRAAGPARKLVAIELLEKAVPRHGFPVRSGPADGAVIGELTSGNLSPILQKGIGLGYVATPHAAVGTAVAVDIRGRGVPAVVVAPPFYRRSRAR